MNAHDDSLFIIQVTMSRIFHEYFIKGTAGAVDVCEQRAQDPLVCEQSTEQNRSPNPKAACRGTIGDWVAKQGSGEALGRFMGGARLEA